MNYSRLLLTLGLFTCFSAVTLAQTPPPSPLVTHHDQPDSVKVGAFLTSLTVPEIGPKPLQAGIQTDMGAVGLNARGQQKNIIFSFPAGATVVGMGIDVQPSGPGKLAWPVDWQANKTYQLMLVGALSDTSMSKNMIYSGYVLMPDQKKWKLIGSCLIDGQRTTLTKLATFASHNPKTGSIAHFPELWLRRDTGSWKNLLKNTAPLPVISRRDPYYDQDEQNKRERAQIEQTVAEGKWAKLISRGGIYYTMLREGTGKPIAPTDSIVAYYKGYLFPNKSGFAEQLTEAATLPLSELLPGLKIGVPFCRVGGKIQLVIPSRYAYGANTLSTLFFPNSILVFEMEILDTKPPK